MNTILERLDCSLLDGDSFQSGADVVVDTEDLKRHSVVLVERQARGVTSIYGVRDGVTAEGGELTDTLLHSMVRPMKPSIGHREVQKTFYDFFFITDTTVL